MTCVYLDTELITTCPICGTEHSVLVQEEDYLAWKSGELAQKVFHYLNAEEREMIISGMCPKCQEEIFG